MMVFRREEGAWSRVLLDGKVRDCDHDGQFCKCGVCGSLETTPQASPSSTATPPTAALNPAQSKPRLLVCVWPGGTLDAHLWICTRLCVCTCPTIWPSPRLCEHVSHCLSGSSAWCESVDTSMYATIYTTLQRCAPRTQTIFVPTNYIEMVSERQYVEFNEGPSSPTDPTAFVSIANYRAADDTQISLTEGCTVTLVEKTNSLWWTVMDGNAQGFAPGVLLLLTPWHMRCFACCCWPCTMMLKAWDQQHSQFQDKETCYAHLGAEV
jgi:hypothetical protein